jgi:hypothetical protein
MMLNLHSLMRITQICGLLSLLTGCYNSMYGIPQQEWVRLNEQQKKAVMDDYYTQQRAQYMATPNYYPTPAYPTQTNIYYTPPPVYVSPRPPRYQEQQRLREAERRAAEHRAREEFARRTRDDSNHRAREEAHRHERHERTYQPTVPIHNNPRPMPYHNNRSDDAPRLPHHNTAPTKPIQLPRPASNFAAPCRGDCKNITR